MGLIIPAVEDRLQTNILIVGGLPRTKPRPEVDEINFILGRHSNVDVDTLAEGVPDIRGYLNLLILAESLQTEGKK